MTKSFNFTFVTTWSWTTIVARHADKSGLRVSSPANPTDCDPIFATPLHGKVDALVSFAVNETRRRRKPYAIEKSRSARERDWFLISHVSANVMHSSSTSPVVTFRLLFKYIPFVLVRSFWPKIVIKNLFQPWRQHRDTWPLRNFKYVSLSLSRLHKRHMHLAFHGSIS